MRYLLYSRSKEAQRGEWHFANHGDPTVPRHAPGQRVRCAQPQFLPVVCVALFAVGLQKHGDAGEPIGIDALHAGKAQLLRLGLRLGGVLELLLFCAWLNLQLQHHRP